jgi:glutamate racemase
MIGIFDSGLGGLTVTKEILKQTPEYKIIYFGDTARLPYGTKQPDLIKSWSENNLDWLSQNGAEVLVIACHTASSWAYDYLREKIEKPLFEMVSPSVEIALNKTRSGRVGVIGTPGTIKSDIYSRKFASSPRIKLFQQACPLFVPMIEEGWINHLATREVAKEYLKPLIEAKIDTLILGCTHYPLLGDLIKDIIGPSVEIIDPAEALVLKIKDFFDKNSAIQNKIKKGNNHAFHFSAQPYNLELISRLCLDREIQGKIVKND